MKARAWSDGGGNSGHLCTAGAVVELNGAIWEMATVLQFSQTNNEAEYNGLLLALQFCLKNGVTDLQMRCDSDLIVQHVKGRNRCEKPNLKILLVEAKRLISKLEKFEIMWIPREENKRADRLCREIKKSFLLDSSLETSFERLFVPPLKPRKRPVPPRPQRKEFPPQDFLIHRAGRGGS